MTRRYPTIAELQAALAAGGVHVSLAELKLRCIEATPGYERVFVDELDRYIALVDAERRALGLPVVPIAASLRLQAVEVDLDDAAAADEHDEHEAVETKASEPTPLGPRPCRAHPSAEELQRERAGYVRRERLTRPSDRKAQHAEVVRLRREGRSLVDIAALTGASVMVARKWTSAAGIRSANRRNSKLSDEQIRELVGLVRAKTPRALIARRYGIEVGTVSAISARHARAWPNK